jgi:MFS family permease
MRSYYAAFFISGWLRRMVAYTAVLYGFEVLGGGQWSGLLYVALVAPYLLSVYAGSVIDASSERAVLRVTSSVVVFLLLLLAVATRSSFQAAPVHGAIVAGLILGVGATAAFAYPAFLSAIPGLQPPSGLGRATALVTVLSMLCYVCAPLVIGGLRKFLPWPGVFLGLAAIASLGSLLQRTIPFAARPKPLSSDSRGVSAADEPARSLFPLGSLGSPVLALLAVAALFSACAAGPLEVFAPLFGHEIGGGDPWRGGLFIAVGGLGLLAGAVVALRLVNRVAVGAWLCGCAAAGGALLIAMTYAPAGPAFALFFAAGIVGGIVNALCLSGIQARAPAALRGRVLGLFSLILGGTPALGGWAAGKLAHALGLVSAMRSTFGVVSVLFVLLFAAVPELRQRRAANCAE